LSETADFTGVAGSNSHLPHLCPKAIPVDKSPVDFETKARSVAELQMTIVQFRVLAEETKSQRIGLRPAM
jgi:hypothetical protein